MKKSANVISPILLVCLAVAVAGGVAAVAYHARQNGTTPVVAVTATPSALPNQTYSNASLGFAFAYPKDWDLVATAQAACGPAGDEDFKATACPLAISLSPQAYSTALTKKYGNASNGLVAVQVIQGSSLTLDSLHSQFKAEYASQDGLTGKASSALMINGLNGFYVNQKTSSYSDNIYVVELASGKYLSITNRELDKHYTPQGIVDDSNDYTSYTPAVRTVLDSITKI